MLRRYDIFSGPRDNPTWLECADDLVAAKEKMNLFAVQKPGQFFIFYSAENRIVAEIYTRFHAAAAGR